MSCPGSRAAVVDDVALPYNALATEGFDMGGRVASGGLNSTVFLRGVLRFCISIAAVVIGCEWVM
ncbi:MAG: hypothetical protein EBU33_04760 [Sphingobacteriia bacterium]|nr:hypothetical protein [Sphingobacteriia bacterium]